MKITWLGQAGLLIQSGEHTLLLDPYLSNSVGDTNPAMHRRFPVEESFFQVKPDLIICTHAHMDHMDLPTLEHWLKQERPVTFLGPRSVWEVLKPRGGPHNYVLFNEGTHWTVGKLNIRAVKAEHSDACAIGVILDDTEECVYITGDTLYNDTVFAALPPMIDKLFLPINGVGNNMNFTDAARFARKSNAKVAIPIHWGLMDELNPEDWDYEPKYIPSIYKEIAL